MIEQSQAQVLAEFLEDPIELVHLSSVNDLFGQVLDRLEALRHDVKIRISPNKPLTRFYILEQDGRMIALGYGATRFEAALAAVLQFRDRLQEKVA